MKKMTKLSLMLLMIVLAMSTGLMAGTYSGGNGESAETAYLIATPANLIELSNTSGDWGAFFKQIANIVFDANEQNVDWDGDGTANWDTEDQLGFSPIGNSSPNFTGSYDGDGHTIDNLFINRSTDHIGLFGYTCYGATIQNIGVTNIDITGGKCTGGLVGYNASSSTVSNSYSTGNVSGTNEVGGLVGNNTESTISNSYSTGSVNGTSYVGGLVGDNYWHSTVSNSYSTGSVSGSGYVGGLVGENNNNSPVSNSYSTGNVSGTAEVGGLVGYNASSSTVSNSYSTGSVSGSGYVGGLVGWNYSSSIVSNSYSTGSVSGDEDVGGLVGINSTSTVSNSFWDVETDEIYESSSGDDNYGATGKTTAEMKAVATFTDTSTAGLTTAWDFETNPNDDDANENYWDIDGSNAINGGYPFLSWQNGADVTLPVDLTLFTVTQKNNKVILNWQTGSEQENLGFVIERKDNESKYVEIASYSTDDELKGQGNTSVRSSYEFTDENVVSGTTYEYRISDVDYSGKITNLKTVTISITANNLTVTDKYTLGSTYPNPFNPTFTLPLQLNENAFVNVELVNILGQKVMQIENKQMSIGNNDLQINCENLNSGVYFVKVTVDNVNEIQKVVLLK